MDQQPTKKSRAVFLDRDGTLIEEKGYISDPSQVSFFQRAVETILALNQSPFLAIMISNQSGVARGYFTESSVCEIHSHIQSLLETRGAYLDGIYYCPHLPEGAIPEYRIQCSCRKPGIGMVEAAQRDFGIERQGSYLIGDKLADIETAGRAGLTGMLVLTGYGTTEWERHVREGTGPGPHLVCKDLWTAVEWIMRKENIQR